MSIKNSWKPAVLTLHNYYQQPGGEDSVREAEAALLRQMGHVVIEFTKDNKEINKMSPWSVASEAIWSRETQQALRKLLAKNRPNIAHFHNTFLRISPAAYYACKEAGVPVIQTLHNYRLLCPAATFFRDGKICEDCLNKIPPWPGVYHGCWRGSKMQTAVVAMMLATHHWLDTWNKQVDLYIALTEFSRKKFIEGGVPGGKVVVKPNFVMADALPDLGKTSDVREKDYALFVGRLSSEKGVHTLLKAWQRVKEIPLKIVGDGPLMSKAQSIVIQGGLDRIELLGRRTRQDIFRLMRRARFLVFPSEWYEGFPMTIVEAFACGAAVLAARLGAMTEIVTDGQTGLFFEPGNAENLAEIILWAWTHPKEMIDMGHNARREYHEKYTPERNYDMLIEIYQKAIAQRGR